MNACKHCSNIEKLIKTNFSLNPKIVKLIWQDWITNYTNKIYFKFTSCCLSHIRTLEPSFYSE